MAAMYLIPLQVNRTINPETRRLARLSRVQWGDFPQM